MIRSLGDATPRMNQAPPTFWGGLELGLCASGQPGCTLIGEAGNVYERIQYGTIPTPAGPTPRAPQTQAQMTVPGEWTPDQAGNSGQDWADATDAQINQAIADGTYNPSGNLPFTAEGLFNFLDQYKWPLMISAVALGGLVVLQVVKR